MFYRKKESAVLTKEKDLQNPFFKRKKTSFKSLLFAVLAVGAIGVSLFGIWKILPDFSIEVIPISESAKEEELYFFSETISQESNIFNILRRPDRNWYDSKVGEFELKIANISKKTFRDIIYIDNEPKIYFLNSGEGWTSVNKETGASFEIEDYVFIENHINNGSDLKNPIIESSTNIPENIIKKIFLLNDKIYSTTKYKVLIYRITDNGSVINLQLNTGQTLTLSERSFDNLDEIISLTEDLESSSRIDARFPGRVYTR